MKLIEKYLFSTRAMSMMLFIYALSMAIATFIENDFGTPAAKEMVFNAPWFVILQVLLIANFILNIKRYQLYRKEKWSILVFHLGFIVTFIGAGITYLYAVEGMMNIREGEVSNEIVSANTFVKMSIFDQDRALAYETPYRMTYFDKKEASFPFKRHFEHKYQFEDKVINLKSLDYIPLAKDTIITGSGKETLEIVSVGENGRKSQYIQAGELKEIGGIMFSMNNPVPGTFQIQSKDNQLLFKSPLEGEYVQMQGQSVGQITDSAVFDAGRGKVAVDSIQELKLKSLYQIGSAQFVLPNPSFKGKLEFIAGNKNNPEEEMNPNVVLMEYDDGEVKDTLVLRGGQGSTAYSTRKSINGLQVSLGFGSKIINTPFGIRLRDFQMETYPGSPNPSSFASEISIVDNGEEKEHRIYMNNVIDYGGYRFFQSGYDPDQLGTRLMVNQDKPGTFVTYVGYMMLFFGMFFSMFWRGTRFHSLQKVLKNLKRHTAIILMLMMPIIGFSQEDHEGHGHKEPISDTTLQGSLHEQNLVMTPPDSIIAIVNFDPEHIKKLEHLLIQDEQGRIKPLGTHALELFRKVYKADKFHGLSSVAWFMSLQQNPALWAQTPLIFVEEGNIGNKWTKELGSIKNHTSLLNLVDHKTTKFKLNEEYNKAFSKKPSEKSVIDKEIINVTERFTIVDNVAKGYFLRWIPLQNDTNETWTSWIKPTQEIEIDTTALAFTSKYFNALGKAQKSGDWSEANHAIDEIDSYQKKWGKNVIPPASKIKIEVLYNHFNPFLWVMIAYATLGGILLILAFTKLFKSNKLVKLSLNTTLVATLLIFIIHAIGLAMRWYISGHAPWTNGYEAVIFISWIAVFAGFAMYRNGNAFLPTAGVAVAVIMMGFAHGSSLLDPQITPLVPVLKSYWLIIHVAIITSSYGFFGLGMVLSLFNMVLFMVKPSKKIEANIKELTIVNEMAVTIGIYMLTIGTFLGGMWANESWGRYWSWDPKETWAFISIIVYAVVLHMRLVPGLRGKYAFNFGTLWATSAPIMTYFGVNYYLSGLHSYAAGDSFPIPEWVPIIVVVLLILSIVAYITRKNYAKNNNFIQI